MSKASANTSTLSRFSKNISAVAPSLAFMALGLWLAWTNLFTGPPIWLPQSAQGSVPLSDLFLASRLSSVACLIACALLHDKINFLFEKKYLALFAGLLLAIGTAIAMIGAGVYASGSDNAGQLICIIGSLCTGCGSATIILCCGILFSQLSPGFILLYTIMTRLVLGYVYFMARSLPEVCITPWHTLPGALFVILLPLLAGLLLCLPTKSSSPNQKPETNAAGSFTKSDKKLFIIMGVAFCVFAFAESFVRVDGRAAGGFGFQQNNDIVMLLMALSCLLLAVIVAGFHDMSSGNIIRLYQVMVFIIVGMVALSPVMSEHSTVWFTVVSFLTKIVALILWCLLGIISHRREVSPIFVFGFGFGMFSSGEVLSLIIGPSSFVSLLGQDAQAFVCIGVAFLVLLMNFLLFSEQDLRLLVFGKEEKDKSMGELFEGLAKQSKITVNEESKDSFEEVLAAIASDSGLSPRELETLRYLALGYTKDAIAKKLCVSNNTIRTHSRNVYAKLNIHSRQELLDLIESHKKLI